MRRGHAARIEAVTLRSTERVVAAAEVEGQAAGKREAMHCHLASIPTKARKVQLRSGTLVPVSYRAQGRYRVDGDREGALPLT